MNYGNFSHLKVFFFCEVERSLRKDKRNDDESHGEKHVNKATSSIVKKSSENVSKANSNANSHDEERAECSSNPIKLILVLKDRRTNASKQFTCSLQFPRHKVAKQ